MLFTRLTTIAFLAATGFWISEAIDYYDITCPGVAGNLLCPEGQVIDRVTMSSGLTSDADCDARGSSAKVLSNECIVPLIEGYAQRMCNGLNRCRPPRPIPLMFKCDVSEDTIVQYNFTCVDKNPDEKTVIACENDYAHLKCDEGTIRIKKVNFGRMDEEMCTSTPSEKTFCMSNGAVDSVKSFCEEKTKCKVQAGTVYLGVPNYCDDLPKYLYVDYLCETN